MMMDARKGLIQLTQLILVFLAPFVPVTLQGHHEERLIRDLLQRRSHHQKQAPTRPIADEHDIIDVYFAASLQQIIKVDEKNEFLLTKLWQTLQWKDYKFSWDKSKYGDITSIRLAARDIWTPDILLYNSAHEAIDNRFLTDVTVTSDGLCRWNPLGIFISSCAIDIRWFPFDDQRCKMKFGSWTHDGTKLNLSVISAQNIDHAVYMPSSEWDLVAMPVKRSERWYECCPYPYIDITYTIHVQRRALYYCFNLVVPSALISVLLLFAFHLPQESGQKINLTITIMLSMSVLQTIVADMVPATSLAVPLIGIYFACVMILCTVSVSVAVLLLNLHNRSPDAYTMPTAVRTMICGWLARLLRMSRPGKSETTAVKRGVERRLILGSVRGRQSRSLLANVLNESDLHLRYRSSHTQPGSHTNAQHRPSTSAADRASADVLGEGVVSPLPEVMSLLEELRYVTKRMRSDEEKEDEINEWKFAAMVIDRLCFYLFSVYLALLTLVFFGFAFLRPIDVDYSDENL